MIALTSAATSFLLACAVGFSPVTKSHFSVSPITEAGLINVESSWQVYAIADVDAHRSYSPTNYFEAVAIVQRLVKEGHDVSAGLAQINRAANWQRFGLNEYNVFEPCLNVSVGAAILQENYDGALRYYRSGDDALKAALSAYNSGRYTAAMGYADDVIAQARAVRFLDAPVYSLPPLRRSPPANLTDKEARDRVLSWTTPQHALPILTTGAAAP
jgi:type IV secretion system protein VirB1